MRPLELLDELSLQDLALWRAYEELEPFGEQRDDYRAAIVAFTCWQGLYALSGKRPPRSIKVEDFLVVRPQGAGASSSKATTVPQMQTLLRGLHQQMKEVRDGADTR